jgi:hypothetical protein
MVTAVQYLRMGRPKYPYSILLLCVISVIVGLSENFGKRTRDEREQEQLARLRELAQAAGDFLTYSVPAVVPENGLFLFDFYRVEHELSLLGYDCVEVHRGVDSDFLDAGIAKIRSIDEPKEIIVGRFERRR